MTDANATKLLSLADYEAMVEALKPFSEAGRRLSHHWKDHEQQWGNAGWSSMPTVGDLRRARAILTKLGET